MGAAADPAILDEQMHYVNWLPGKLYPACAVGAVVLAVPDMFCTGAAGAVLAEVFCAKAITSGLVVMLWDGTEFWMFSTTADEMLGADPGAKRSSALSWPASKMARDELRLLQKQHKTAQNAWYSVLRKFAAAIQTHL